MYQQSIFCKSMETVEKVQLKIVIFTAVKSRCMLHGRAFVMRFSAMPEKTAIDV